MNSELERAKKYSNSLNEIRLRLAVLESMCQGSLTTGSEYFDYELAAVNLRKILENIAFGSLTANSRAYEGVYAGIEKIWRAKELLDKLERMYVDFYPKPLEPPVITDGIPRKLHFELLTSGFLTRVEFVELYDLCSSVIHSQNPFKPSATINFRLSVMEWVHRIRSLLRFHFFRLSGLPQLWLGELEGPDGFSHVQIASPT
ncbi:hypothetical protein GTP41_21800 [Pseudoduganella sp. DS3]|uniref:Uncharacterized protein n=1 Tax=Pseudoduganella guangdongensis TaxID=2692179 RepID=A0A6N9HPK3_9BURK|nr:hypothetical protein [Pseudoduganella guangdongensis]MYN04732.1 hypothetical protein [Pseudoduganella guangdongensis]